MNKGEQYKEYFPGSMVERRGKTAREFLDGLFFATSGLMLSQVKEITGLDAPVMQNWANRGWTQKTVNKRYTKDHLARILIINMLRGVMQLESIAGLLAYINGAAGDKSDDVLPESELYCEVCEILDKAGHGGVLDEKTLIRAIDDATADYSEPFAGGTEKLRNGLKILTYYFAAALLRRSADDAYAAVLSE